MNVERFIFSEKYLKTKIKKKLPFIVMNVERFIFSIKKFHQ
jgi:hypothetical protein